MNEYVRKSKTFVSDIKADVERKKRRERIAAEEAKIQAEKEELLSLTEKELLVEAVMALRGVYSRIEELCCSSN